MNDVDEDKTMATSLSGAPPLNITVGAESYTVEAADAPITIGRVFPAQILVSDSRISRNHLRLEVTGARWVAVDHSSNGVFLDRQSVPSVIVTDGLTLHLGNPDGIAVHFSLAAPTADASTTGAPPRSGTDDPDEDDGEDDDEGDEDDESGERTGESDYVDPGVARAGAAVASRRRELDIAQRVLAKDKVVNAGTLIAFEKGRSWPRRSTLAKLEEVLRWEPGTITRIRWGHDPESRDAAEQTTVLHNTAQAPFMAQAFEVALNSIGNQIASLPATSEADFTQRIGMVLADLRRLEQVASNAARSTTGAADVVLVLSAVRRQYRDLMLRAARSPHATLGQQLFAARHRAELSAEEAANAAGLSVDTLTAVEADQRVDTEATAAVHALLTSLPRS